MISEADLNTLVDVAVNISVNRRKEMSEHGLWLYQRYFSSMAAITLTTLDIINDRVFPHYARVYDDWNVAPHKVSMDILCRITCQVFHRS